MPAPPVAARNKCGAFGQLILGVVAIAVGSILGGPLGTALGSKIGGAVAAAALASTASQGVGLATGIQDKFSWKGVALAGLSAGVGAGISQAATRAAGVVAKTGSSASGLTRAVAGLSGNGIGASIGTAAVGSAASQGLATLTGLQDRFSWAGIAAAGVSAGVGTALGGALSGSGGGITQSTAVHGASLLASAATRSALEGSSFARNITAGLPDVLAQTIVDVGMGVARGGGARTPMGLSEETAVAGSPSVSMAGFAPDFAMETLYRLSLYGPDPFNLPTLTYAPSLAMETLSADAPVEREKTHTPAEQRAFRQNLARYDGYAEASEPNSPALPGPTNATAGVTVPVY